MLSNLINGAGYLLQGAALLKHPRILPFAALPIAINLILYYLGYSYFTELFEGWLTGFTDKIPAWLDFVETLLTWLFRIALLLIMALTFTFAANLIGSPFYGLMAEQIELIQNPQAEAQPFSVKELLAIIPRSIFREIQKIIYYLLRAVPLLLLSVLSLIFAPLATLTPIIWFLFGSLMLSIQYVDYAYDNNKLTFKVLVKDIRRERSGSIGFGAVCMLAAMVPFLNILAVPAAVCGGTLFYTTRLKNRN